VSAAGAGRAPADSGTGPGPDLPGIGEIRSTTPVGEGDGERIGRSREGRPLEAFRFGRGTLRVSLLGGCHADEPVGPALLRCLAALLGDLPPDAPALEDVEWWILPHANPDGEAMNRAWQEPGAERYDLAGYLRGVRRESPGDDVEFGFPRGPDDGRCRPENRAIQRWWRTAGGPFHVHASLHGMTVGLGPWFLLEESWADRTRRLRERCRLRARALGYRVHDEDRGGEKGFRRIGRGFSTRPDSRAMRDHFLSRDDEETASRFRPSSMEAIRALSGDVLTVVPEMPLFVVEGGRAPAGETAPPVDEGRGTVRAGDGDRARDHGPVGPDWKRGWQERLESWATALRSGRMDAAAVRKEARELRLRAMPVADQMELQWTLIRAAMAAARP